MVADFNSARCPKCGSSNKAVEEDVSFITGATLYYVKCKSCDFSTGKYLLLIMAQMVWVDSSNKKYGVNDDKTYA